MSRLEKATSAACNWRFRQLRLVPELFVVTGVFFFVRWLSSSASVDGIYEAANKNYVRKDLQMRLGEWDITQANINDSMSLDIAEEMLMGIITTPDIVCVKKRKVGGAKTIDDGWKMVCLEPPLDLKANNCLIYSFGINNEWSFEDQIVKDFGCKIYAYDPSISAPAKRGNNIFFQPTGLGANSTTYKGWKMRTLGDLMAENQHTNAVIDYLKIDIEGTEYTTLATAMKEGSLAKAKQLGIEIHFFPYIKDNVDGYKTLYREFMSYKAYGFKLWSSWMNIFCRRQAHSGFRRSYCHELVYINERFLPK